MQIIFGATLKFLTEYLPKCRIDNHEYKWEIISMKYLHLRNENFLNVILKSNTTKLMK